MMKKVLLLGLVVLCLPLTVVTAQNEEAIADDLLRVIGAERPAEETSSDNNDTPAVSAAVSDEVYVTTQDYVSLRRGPGTTFERLAVVPAATTLRAIGRSDDTGWIQVIYEDQTGWVAQRLLVWSGDVVSLTVDGIDPEPFHRRLGVIGFTARRTPIYQRQVTPEDRIGYLPAGVQVEITGRLGFGNSYWLQIFHEGELYWVGSYDIRVVEGSSLTTFDTAYLYPYGRLATQLDTDISDSTTSLRQIENIWQQLEAGEGVSCGFIPDYASRSITDTDIRREPVFAPLVTALDNAIAQINAPIAAFEDACGRRDENFFLTQDDVRTALGDIADARRNLVLAASLLTSLQVRNPLTTENQPGNPGSQ